MEFLHRFPQELLQIAHFLPAARAGAGVNNLSVVVVRCHYGWPPVARRQS
jgi:hypothetical protein